MRPAFDDAQVIYHLRNGDDQEAYDAMASVEPTTPSEYILKAIVNAVRAACPAPIARVGQCSLGARIDVAPTFTPVSHCSVVQSLGQVTNSRDKVQVAQDLFQVREAASAARRALSCRES